MLTHTDTNTCRLSGLSLAFISVVLVITNNSNIKSKMINDLLLNYIGCIGSISPVNLVNVYMLSVQVMKRTIKLLSLLGRHLASRAIKQLNEHITTAVLNTGRQYNT